MTEEIWNKWHRVTIPEDKFAVSNEWCSEHLGKVAFPLNSLEITNNNVISWVGPEGNIAPKGCWDYANNFENGSFIFQNEKDAVLFKLRWV